MLDAPWKIELLGRLCARQSGRTITRFRTYKTGVLLAYLAFYRQQTHPREVLMELLWPECEPTLGRNSLSQALSSLRHQLEPPGVPTGAILLADRTNIGLNLDACTTDVAEFEAAFQTAARAPTAAERLPWLTQAVELYHGELLPGYYENWNLQERDRLKESYLQALSQLIADREQAGDLDSALDYARRAVSAEPLREESHVALIRLHVALGQPAAALRQYHELKRILEEELGETPSAATRSLLLTLKTNVPSAPPTTPPAPAPAAAPPTLPAGTVTFLVTDAENRGDAAETLRAALRRHGGQEVETAAGIEAAFARASDALACAIAIQRSLSAPSAAERALPRMALHTGEIGRAGKRRADRKPPAPLNQARRVLAATHAGQILCSEGTAVLLRRDLEPGLKLTDLGVYRLRGAESTERLFEVDYPGRSPQEFPPPDAEPGYTGNLPLQFSRFFGRAVETGGLQALLSPGQERRGKREESTDKELGDEALEIRLVTLTGPGGTGKTRLALEVARRLLEPFRNAVWFVPLAALSDPGLLPDAVMAALQLSRSSSVDPFVQVVEMLNRQPALLILDNCEQLLEGTETAPLPGVQWVRSLLERVPELRCLVTSRRRLGLLGEREFPLAPLPIPQGADTPEQLTLYESVQLFVDRAQAVRPDFQVTNGNAAAVAGLCARLEGIPLALELAAARSQVLTPAQILNRLSGRLDFLSDSRRQTDARHQTLRAAIDWSYRLLSAELQHFFGCLAVFRGSWSLEAAEVVCAEPLALDYLAMLRECSLLLALEEDPEGMRFRLLETLREYAEDKLTVEEREGLRRRHAEFFLALAVAAKEGMDGPEQSLWLARLEQEHDNLRAALRWCLETGEAEMGLRLGGALASFWGVRGHLQEGRETLSHLLALPESRQVAPTVRAEALNGLGRLAYGLGDYTAAQTLHEESLALCRQSGDKSGTAWALHALGSVAFERSDYAAAQSLQEESLTLQRELQDQRGIAASLWWLGVIATNRGDYAAARTHLEESLALRQEAGDRGGIASALNSLGIVARGQGDHQSARTLYEQALALYREIGAKRSVAAALGNLGLVATDQGDFATARALYEEALTIQREMGARWNIATLLYNLGGVARAQTDMAAAQRLFAESLTIRRELGNRWGVAYALSGLGAVACERGDYAGAQRLFAESLTLKREIGDRPGIVAALDEFATLAVAQGQEARAATLYGAADALRTAIGAPLPPAEHAEHARQLQTVQAALTPADFDAAYAQGQAMPWEQAVTFALSQRMKDEG
jgi:predicted ATPase/DNA-binding SARP family transcriptional activator/Tfp pilus assembly protein PilF